MIKVSILAPLGWLVTLGATPAVAQQPERAPVVKPSGAPTGTMRAVPYATKARWDADTCYAPEDHHTAELCAQWRAALAAEKAADEARRATFLTIIGTILSGLAVGGLIYTIRQTHGALGEARRGNRIHLLAERRARQEARKGAEQSDEALKIAARNAEAAAAHVAVAKEAVEAQMRAWVVFDSVVATEVTEAGQTFFDVAVVWKNGGKTPARNFRIGISWKTVLPGAPLGAQAQPTPQACVAGVLGPELTVWSPAFRLTPAQFLNHRMSIISRITYNDVFSRRRRVGQIHVEALVIQAPGNQYAMRWTVIGDTTAT